MRMRSIPVFLALAAAVAACTAKEESATKTPAVAQAGAPAASPNVVKIEARDFAFVAPDSIPAGVTTFQLTNDGPSFHHMQLVRLDSDKTAADLMKAMKNPGPPPRWAVFVGGPNAPNPKAVSNATLDMTAGNYAVLCLVDVPDGVPHFAKGMVHPLTVVASSANAAAPKPDVTVSLADYSFAVSTALAAGKHVVDVENTGPQPHEVEVVKLAPGATPDKMIAWIMKPNGPPPGSAIGGVAALVPGAHAQFAADFTPGNYALICFIPDGKDGKPHFMHGMVKTITVS